MDGNLLQVIQDYYRKQNPSVSDQEIFIAFQADAKQICAAMCVNHKANLNLNPVQSFVSHRGTLCPKG